MDPAGDTEFLLALLSSLLEFPVLDQTSLLDALVKCDGDVQAAARLMNSRANDSQTRLEKKRKRVGNLDDWLKPSVSKKPPSMIQGQSSACSSDSNSANVSNHTVQISTMKPQPVNLITVLRQAPPLTRNVLRLPPLTLTYPDQIAKHTPCTLHLSVLPAELACRLFYTMIDLSREWKRNKWWLFDRVVESPHRTSFFARKHDGAGDETWQEAAQYWYNGRKTEPPAVFPDVMEEACTVIERVVNTEMRKRGRFPLEWANPDTDNHIWQANVAASNCYEGGKESVGFHTDQLTYLGPYPTIASLSLGVNRMFRMREVVPTEEKNTRQARTFNIPLPHNSLTIMHASTQEAFKHSIPPQSVVHLYRPLYPRHPDMPIEPSNCRINITFRFYRPDFSPSSIPRCKCDIPTILRPDMKNRVDGKTDQYWWTCYAGAQNDGKGCNFWKVMDMREEGRGPVVADVTPELK